MATRGDVTEGAVLGAFTKLGLDVLVPWRHDLPYDLVVDLGAQFLRVQCKSGRHKDGCVIFNSAATNHGSGNRSYVGLADVFAVYCPALDRVFVVPVEHAATRSTRLRLRPSRNGQVRGINNAEDYAVERWAAEVAVSRVFSTPEWISPSSSPGPPGRCPPLGGDFPPRSSGVGATGSSSTVARGRSGS